MSTNQSPFNYKAGEYDEISAEAVEELPLAENAENAILIGTQDGEPKGFESGLFITDAELLAEIIGNSSTGAPAPTDQVPYLEITEAVSRIVRGTATNVGTDGETITIGGVTLEVGDLVVAGFSATNYASQIVSAFTSDGRWAQIPLEDSGFFVDNGDGTFDITFAAGANALEVSTTDPNLSFEETQGGANEIKTLKQADARDLVTPEALTTTITEQPVADALAGSELVSVVQDDVVVTNAGTPAADGAYEYQGQNLGYPFYTLAGSNPYVSSAVADNTVHGDPDSTVFAFIVAANGDRLYISNSAIDTYPDADNQAKFFAALADLVENDGIAPVPTVSATPTLKIFTVDAIRGYQSAVLQADYSKSDDTHESIEGLRVSVEAGKIYHVTGRVAWTDGGHGAGARVSFEGDSGATIEGFQGWAKLNDGAETPITFLGAYIQDGNSGYMTFDIVIEVATSGLFSAWISQTTTDASATLFLKYSNIKAIDITPS